MLRTLTRNRRHDDEDHEQRLHTNAKKQKLGQRQQSNNNDSSDDEDDDDVPTTTTLATNSNLSTAISTRFHPPTLTVSAAGARRLTRTRIKHRLCATLSTTPSSTTPSWTTPSSSWTYTASAPVGKKKGASSRPLQQQHRMVASVSESSSSPDTTAAAAAADNISIGDKGSQPAAAASRSLEFPDEGMDSSDDDDDEDDDDDATEASFGSCDAVDMNAYYFGRDNAVKESNNCNNADSIDSIVAAIRTGCDDDDDEDEDRETARGLCNAICLDGYRCPRLSKSGEPLCQFHLEQKLSAATKPVSFPAAAAADHDGSNFLGDEKSDGPLEDVAMSSSGDDEDDSGQGDREIIVIDDTDDDDGGDDDADDDETKGPYTYDEFEALWVSSEVSMGEEIDEIERSHRIRAASHEISREDTDGQSKAQYGRLLPIAMKTLMKDVMKLSKDDVFLDIGHGIGNTCLQASFTIGCESRGIEVVRDRNEVAKEFRSHMIAAAKQNPGRKVGEVKLRHGRLEDESHRKFLLDGVTHVFLNNFNGNFADKSAKPNQPHILDDHNAGLFGLMKPGTMMITLHELPLVGTRDEVNEERVKKGLRKSPYASFYDRDKILLGKLCDTVKWKEYTSCQDEIYVYRYKRLEQPSEKAVFLCCNPSCENARKDIPISATTINADGRAVMNHCSYCKITRKSLRPQARIFYGDDE